MEIGLGELLELYEYKIEDLIHGREPKGGRASVQRLRQLILSHGLKGYWGKRFREIDRRYKAYRGKMAASEPSSRPAPDLTLIEVPVEDALPGSPPSPEKEVLEAFAKDVYGLRLKREMARTARALVKGQRYELRLAYAFTQNFEAYAATETFRRDFNLSRFTPSHPIPSLSDPLAAFDDEEVATEVLLELFRIAMSLNTADGYGLQLPAEETVPYFRRFFRRLIESPKALGVGRGVQGPSVAEIRRALEEARRSAMTPHERAALIRDLEAKLHRAAEEERRAQLVVEEDRRRFLGAAERLVALLRRYLPPPKGEGAYPRLPQRILGGRDPALRLEAVPEKATVLTLRLMPLRLRLGEVDLVVGEAGGEYTLSLEGADYPLVEGEPLVVPCGQWEVWAFRRGAYAHVRLEVREGAHLSQLLVEGRILAHLVHPVKAYAYLRLMRAFSARLKGPVEYREFGPELARKFAEVPPDTLEEFARKGLKVVRQRLERTPSGLRYLGEVAEALELVPEARHLQALLVDWLNYRPPTRETIGGEIGTATLTTEPVSINVGKVVLSVRQVEDAVYVTMAGQVPRRLRDLLVWTLTDRAVVIAREGHRVAHVVIPITGAAQEA